MIGILLVSHGPLAEGLFQTASFFLGEMPQITYRTLSADTDPSIFLQDIKSAIQEIDQGDGVYILCDLLGGTPFNQSMLLNRPDISIFTGMNLPLLLELAFSREPQNIDCSQILDSSKSGIRHFPLTAPEDMDYDEE